MFGKNAIKVMKKLGCYEYAKSCSSFITVLDHMVRTIFINNMTGPEVEAVRRAVKAYYSGYTTDNLDSYFECYSDTSKDYLDLEDHIMSQVRSFPVFHYFDPSTVFGEFC